MDWATKFLKRKALKNSQIMLKALENAKRNGLIDKKVADDNIKNLKASMKLAEEQNES